MTPITATPDEHRRITDDTDAKTFLIEHGLLDKFLEYGKPPGLSGEWAAKLDFDDHPTHWIRATYYCGFSEPFDNGYTIDCFPKSRYSIQQFRFATVVGDRVLFSSDGARGESGTLHPPPN